MAALQDAVAIVTGSGRGIGRAIAEELGHGGAKVVVNYAHSREAADDAVAALRTSGSPQAVAIQADVADAEQAARLIADTVERFGRLDILVNNAGITLDRTMRKLSIDEWDRVIHVDLNSCFYTVKAALPRFIEQSYGRIINISSFVAQAGNFGQTNYAAAKAGIIGFTKSAAIELARYNVTVNAVCPGFVDTEMYQVVPDNVKELILKRIPMGRVAQPAEIARCVRFLIVDGDYITGEAISINGGLYMD
jgi:acetoacetyl-CoA reductase